AAQRRLRIECFARCDGADPILIRFEFGDETFQPAICIAMIVGPRPDAEFLHVVAHGRDSAGPHTGGFAEKAHDFLRAFVWDEIAKSFQPWEWNHRRTLILGHESSV